MKERGQFEGAGHAGWGREVIGKEQW